MPSVSIPIIDQLVHPSIGLLTRVAVPGNPQVGPFVSLSPPQNPLVALTYGIVLRIHHVGPGHGHTVSFPQIYNPPLGQMCSNYTDLGGTGVEQQVENWLFDNQWYVWNEPLPAQWTLFMAPDVQADLFYLQT